jgi:uncharacterized protein (TIGR03437 family)
VNVNVTLNVRAVANLTASQNNLVYTFRTGGATPSSQPVQIGSTGSSLGFSVTSNESWLRVSPSSGTTPATIQVSVEPGGLAPGAHTGTITVTSTGGGSASTQTINVSLQVTGPLPTIDRVGNAASYSGNSLAPAEIVVLEGSFIGPEQLTTANLIGNAFPTAVAETRVLFNGQPGRILYTRADQVAAIVPLAVAGRTEVGVQVEYRGQRSNVITLPLTQTAPGIFTLNASGSGPGAILNQDGTVNTLGNGAARGDVVIVFATGGGQTFPVGNDGAVATGADRTVLPFEAEIGGLPAEVVYAGASPGLVVGALQLNIRIPLNLAPGTHQIVIRSNNVSSQQGVTLVVR